MPKGFAEPSPEEEAEQFLCKKMGSTSTMSTKRVIVPIYKRRRTKEAKTYVPLGHKTFLSQL